MGAQLKIMFPWFSCSYDQLWPIGCEWKWYLQRPNSANSLAHLLLYRINVRDESNHPGGWNGRYTLRMAEQQTQATHQRAHHCLPRLVYERNMLLSCLSLWVRGLLCKSCLTFSPMNVSSFSCFKHKALTPNVINPRKPGQCLTGKDFIPTRLCSFVLKISEQGLSFNALSHCTGGTCPEQTAAHGTDVYWIMHCFFIEEAQSNTTSEAEVSRRRIMSSASEQKTASPRKLKFSIQPNHHFLIDQWAKRVMTDSPQPKGGKIKF